MAEEEEGIIMPGQVTTQMGKITINGLLVTGAQARFVDNSAIDNEDEDDWKLMAWDAIWQRNSALVSLTYNNGKYGGYINMGAEDWDGNIENGFNNFAILHAYIWRSFLDSKLKASIGLLPSQILQSRESVWKVEGATNGGWSINDNYERYASFRLEFKPIEGLNVGTQINFLPQGQSPTSSPLGDLSEFFKETTLAAEYKGKLFNALAGVRFDGADGINKFDTGTYLKDYYGEWGYIGNNIQNTNMMYEAMYPGVLQGVLAAISNPTPGSTQYAQAEAAAATTTANMTRYSNLSPHWKYGNEVYGKTTGNFTTANADKPFYGSHRLVLGFNYKGVQNLTAKMQGSLWNPGDFDRFGTASFDETIRYQITPQFNAGIIMYQEFYGSDVFHDNMINSPYLRFEPVASYQLTRNISANFLATIGIAKDMVESDWRIKPSLAFTLGGFGTLRGELFYELNAITYTGETVSGAQANFIPKMMQAKGGEAIYTHNIGLSVMWMF
jgi:hypothetical protein